MNNVQSRIKFLNTITRSNPNLVRPCYCKKAAKKLPAENFDVDLNRQEHFAGEIFCLAANVKWDLKILSLRLLYFAVSGKAKTCNIFLLFTITSYLQSPKGKCSEE